ncbi:hypothetical protein P3S67_004081 [Capsicum chacoense]
MFKRVLWLAPIWKPSQMDCRNIDSTMLAGCYFEECKLLTYGGVKLLVSFFLVRIYTLENDLCYSTDVACAIVWGYLSLVKCRRQISSPKE